MLEHITGRIIYIQKNELTVSIGNIGMSVSVPNSQQYVIESQVTLYTYLHWHQEQGPSIFGFDTIIEKKFFLTLLNCSGIGPKIALAAIGTLGIQPLVNAIATQNIQLIAQVPGIGLKKAESLSVMLKDKARDFLEVHKLTNTSSNNWLEVHQALVSLGYSTQEINYAISALPKNQSQDLSFDQQLRQALQALSR